MKFALKSALIAVPVAALSGLLAVGCAAKKDPNAPSASAAPSPGRWT